MARFLNLLSYSGIFLFSLLRLSATESDSPVKERSWSIVATGVANIPVSASMRGTPAEFRAEIAKDYTNTKYPFASPEYAIGWSAKLLYALPSSAHTDLFLGLNGNFIAASESTRQDRAFMAVWGVNFGAEYSLLPRWNTLNVYGRAGVSAQFITGFTNYSYGFGMFRTNVPVAGRLGIEAELGGRWLIPSTPIALELSRGYVYANLIGKSYENPMTIPKNDLYERQLNDGANPNNPDDKSRIIDFASIRLGGRIWF